MKKIFIMTILFLIFIPSICTATETTSQDVLQSQQEELNISSFIKEAQKYTQNTFKDIDVNELFTSAITGKIDNDTIIKSIVSLVGKEVLNCATVLGSILVIIIIHSILKSISEGLENKNVAQITYYVQYILIVTLIMANFSDILQMVKTSIQNLVGFMNSLVPLLITLMLTTGNFASAGILEPIILFIITFIGNFITTILLPFVLISTALAIISKVSSRIQVDKLSKFFNSTVVWTLGVVLTLFVGIISVEGRRIPYKPDVEITRRATGTSDASYREYFMITLSIILFLVLVLFIEYSSLRKYKKIFRELRKKRDKDE